MLHPGAATAKTHEDGSYALEGLPIGAYTVAVEPKGDLAAVALTGVVVKLGQPTAAPDIALAPAGFIEGTVTLEGSGKSAPRCPVFIRGPARTAEWPQWVVTDADGHYRAVLPPGTHQLAVPRGLDSVGPLMLGDMPGRKVQVEAGKTAAGIDFTVPQPHEPEAPAIIVVNPDGSPARKVPVTLVADTMEAVKTYQTETNDWGRAEFEGEALMRINGASNVGSGAAVLVSDAARGLAGVASVSPGGGAVKVQLAPGAYVTARVLDPSGKPLDKVGAQVMVRLGEYSRLQCLAAESDKQGNFRIGPLPTQLPLCVLPNKDILRFTTDTKWRDRGFTTLTSGQELRLPDLRLNLAGLTAKGRVLDPAGKPVAKAVVVAMPVPASSPDADLSGDHWDALAAETDASGRFRLGPLPCNGAVGLLAACPQRSLYVATRITPASAAAVQLTVLPLGKAAGRVLKADGTPLANSPIDAFADALWGVRLPERPDYKFLEALEKGPEGKTDAQGRWQVSGLVSGLQYNVGVPSSATGDPMPSGGMMGVGTFVAHGGQAVVVPEIRIEPSRFGVPPPPPVGG